MAITLNGEKIQVEKNYLANLMNESVKASPIFSLTNTEPVIIGDNEIMFYDGGIEAGVVNELGVKPASDAKFTTSTLKPVKLAALFVASEEAFLADKRGQMETLQADLINAISRAITLGVTHGKSTKTGNAIPEVSYLAQAAHKVYAPVLGPNQFVTALSDGINLIEGASNVAEVDGFLVDSTQRLNVLPLAQLNAVGNLPVVPQFNAKVANVGGIATAFGRGVNGKLGQATATDMVAFAGDFTRGLRIGYGMDLTLKTSTEATIVDANGDAINLWQQNARAVMAEVVVGWAVNPNLFAAIHNSEAPTTP